MVTDQNIDHSGDAYTNNTIATPCKYSDNKYDFKRIYVKFTFNLPFCTLYSSHLIHNQKKHFYGCRFAHITNNQIINYYLEIPNIDHFGRAYSNNKLDIVYCIHISKQVF